MSEIKWTNEQKEAIDFSGNSIIVSAAAGSGKTAVLVERIIRLLEKTDVDRLLIVTFTNAAAAQMKKGITEAIEKKLSASLDKDEIKHYHHQLLLLPGANITTMHSFCSRLVREHFDKLDLSSDFSVGEPAQLQLLLEDSMNELLEESYQMQTPDFLSFADAYSQSKNDTSLATLINQLHTFVQSVPYPDQWLDMVADIYDTDDINTAPWVAELLEESVQELKGLFDIIYQGEAELESNPELSYFVPYFLEAREITEGFLEACSSYSSAYGYASSIAFRPLRTPKGMGEHPTAALLKELRDAFKKKIQQICESKFFFSPEKFTQILNKQSPHIKTLCHLVKGLEAIYQRKKSEKNVVDFNDLEHGAIRLLTNSDGTPSPIAEALKDEFDEIVVDEYQDTNIVQETIFNSISKNNSNLFMVGDRKQSIYRFRNTAPELFSKKVETYTDDGNGNGKKIYLSNNFRSRTNVLDFANLIFSQLMSEKTCGLDYTGAELLRYGATNYPQYEEKTELYIRERPEADADGEILSTTRQEATLIALRIQDMVENKYMVTDKKTQTLRPVKYSDFAILTRNSKGVSSDISEVLSAYGIPVFFDGGGEEVLDSMEIQTLLSVLKIIDNPYQDIPMVSVLRSPIYSFSDDLLALIRKSADAGTPFFTAVRQYVGTSKEDSEKINNFLTQLSRWRKKAVYTPISKLIEDILEETGYEYFVCSLPGGAQRRSNLHFLTETARSFEASAFKGLFHFLNYLDQFAPTGTSFSAPKLLPDNADVVTITTIHKSKGLEYPIVFIPLLGREFTNKDLQSKLLIHKDIGFGFDYQNNEQHIKIASPVRKAIAHKIIAENIAEEIRVLYVALTRAKEKTILLGTVADRSKLIKKVSSACAHTSKALPPHLIYDAKSYLEWLCLALSRYSCFDCVRNESAPFEDATDFITIHLSDFDEVQTPSKENASVNTDSKSASSPELIKLLEYPYPDDKNPLFAKYSVTELKKKLNEDENSMPYYPPVLSLATLSDKAEISPTHKGTLTHLVMEKIDFPAIASKGDVESFLVQMEEEGYMSFEERQTVCAEAIYKFICSPLGQRLKNSPEISREAPFNIFIDGKILSPDAEGTKVQLQGVIDCYFKEDNRYVIIDYKTDRLTPDNKELKVAEYKKQLLFYKEAVALMHPDAEYEGYLYFFDADLPVFLF